MANDAERWAKEEATAWCSGDVEKILSFYTDDCVYEDFALGKVCRGMGELRPFISDAYTAFPDFKVELKSCFTSGDRVCMESVFSGTHRGNIPGLPPPTGRAFSVRCAHICELREGKAFRVADYYDMASMLRQLGVLPSSPQP